MILCLLNSLIQQIVYGIKIKCIIEEQQNIVLDTKKYKIFNKNVYTAVNDELEEYIKINNIDLIYLCGFDTDACVLKTALDLFEKGYEVYVLKDYCMSNAGFEIHNSTINNLKIVKWLFFVMQK